MPVIQGSEIRDQRSEIRDKRSEVRELKSQIVNFYLVVLSFFPGSYWFFLLIGFNRKGNTKKN